MSDYDHTRSLREKCPNTEFFLVRIFLYLDWMQENTDQKKLHIWRLFTQWFSFKIQVFQVGGPYHIETSQLICRAFAESWKS